jgi:hypothetical protein
MLATQLAGLLQDAPPGIGAALDVVAGFDEALVHGLGRLGERHAVALSGLAAAVATTPLGGPVAAAVEVAGPVADGHLAALAGGRTAVLGAVHDALLGHVDAALGRSRAPWPAAAAPGGVGPRPTVDNLLGGARSWLHELAITGWRGIDHDLVSAVDQALGTLLAEPGLRRLAVLLDGLAAELRACCPVGTVERLPARRWADLWARALLLAQAGGWPGPGGPATPVSGRLLILGVDVHEHGTAVQVQVHGVLEPTGDAPPRLVRTSVAAAKVDTIVGPAVWRLLDGYPVLLNALAERRSLDVTDLPLLDGGDLEWHDDRARAGEVADPFATARIRLGGALAPAVPPLDRHPVRIAEPVLIEGYTTDVEEGMVTLDLGGNRLPVAVDRLPGCGPLTPHLVAGSSACLGLLRWDDARWSVQPLAVASATKRATVTAHNGDWALGSAGKGARSGAAKAGAAKSGAAKAGAAVKAGGDAKPGGDAVAVLRERAGRLLRR